MQEIQEGFDPVWENPLREMQPTQQSPSLRNPIEPCGLQFLWGQSLDNDKHTYN